MVKLRLPMMVQDPAVAQYKGVQLLDNVELDEEFYLDGPVSKRVAVIDFDEKSGALQKGIRFLSPPPGRVLGDYEIADRGAATSRDLLAVSVFATVVKTMQLFEKKDALGRPLTWAFNHVQLLVVPQAGKMSNAYYERESRSLQFFFFPATKDPSRTIFSSASRDIVAHETAHAILDGILPDLYSASTPQALALHESVADLTALLSSFECRELATAVLRDNAGRLDKPSAFSFIAEEFGMERGAGPLRTIHNTKSLDPKSGRDFVANDEPHDLSEVLSGALYEVMVAVYGQWLKKFPRPEEALGIASRQFRRMIYRALDYLPPGEISFADYGRAILAADQAHHPDEASGRKALVSEFVKRNIVPNERALSVKTNYRLKELRGIEVETLCTSDWAAYEFANRNRKLFGIPDKVHFRVLPRRDSTKSHRHRGGREEDVRECIFKVSWDEKENHDLGSRFPSRRQITVGATLVIDWNTGMARALLKSDFANQKKNRDALLSRLVAEDRLRLGDEAAGTRRRPLSAAVRAETMGDLMRVRGTARMLHIAR